MKRYLITSFEELFKSRVKAHIRTRKGKLESVKEHSRMSKYLEKDKSGLTLKMRNILRQAGDKVIHTTYIIHDEDRKLYAELSAKGFLEFIGVEGRASTAKYRITTQGKQLVKLLGKELED
jgi:hypothetical protein